MTELEFEAHLKELAELAERNGWEHVIRDTFFSAKIEDAKERLESIEAEIKEAKKRIAK